MAKLDRFRSPEEAERLADLKRGVDLGALATERYGYTLSERTREGGFTLRNEGSGGGDRITVKMAPEGYHMYHNHNDDRDKGSVVDFLQQRHPDRNLGQVKGMLQEMVPGAKSALDYEKYQAQQVQKAPGAAEARYEALPASERRAAMVRETMGPNPALTDASYLLERGLSKETVNDPAFKNRVFTDQHPERQERLGVAQHNVGFPFYNEKGAQSFELRNRAAEGETDSFKMMMKAPGDEFGAKNGVWSSNTLNGRGTQPERLILGESPIDMMSKYQTERAAAAAKGEEMPNSRYVATGGTPSIEQKAIIQNLIDKEQPKQVILSNDNDAAGQAFNVRYLNDLRTPQEGLSPEQQAEAAVARERTTWIAGDNGKKGEEKLLTMTISFKHETAKDGRQAVESLRTQAEMRGLPAEEPGTPGTAGLQVRRNAPEVTEVVLRVAPAQADAVVDLARELRRERELAMPEAARTPENYLVVEKANGKDYNQDILQSRADAQLDAARREAGFTVAPEVAPVLAAAAPEIALERAQLRVSDNEPLPAGVQAPDDRFRNLAQEVRSALEEKGLQVEASPVPGATGTLVRTYLEFEYAPNSPQGLAAQQIVADVQANAPGRVDALGIEPAGEPQAQPRFNLGLPLDYAPVALQTGPEASAVLEARLYATEMNVQPTQVNNEPGFVVLLDRGSAREAAQLEHIVQLHEKENVAPLTQLQSEATANVRQQGVAAYYDYDLGNNTQPPALTAYVLTAEPTAEQQERLTSAGATTEPTFRSEAMKEANAPVEVRVAFPLDQPEVAANVSRVLDTMEVTGERRWDREAREQLAERLPAARSVEAAATPAPQMVDVLDRYNPDPEKNYAKLGYPGSATAAVGYPGTEEAYKQQLVEAGATLIERPVTELAPAGTQSIAYPLDQPEVVARVSEVLDEIEAAAKARTANVGAEAGPVGVFEDPAYRETRQQAASQEAELRTTIDNERGFVRDDYYQERADEARDNREADRQAEARDNREDQWLVANAPELALNEARQLSIEREARLELSYREQVLQEPATLAQVTETITSQRAMRGELSEEGSLVGAVGGAMVGYPGNNEAVTQQLVEAGATLVDKTESGYKAADTNDFRYPLDQPEVVARVSVILDEVAAQAGREIETKGYSNLPSQTVGVLEGEEIKEIRQQTAQEYQLSGEARAGQQAAEQQLATGPIAADINLNGSTSAEEIIRADRNRDGVVTESELTAARFDARQGQEQPAASEQLTAQGPIAADINLNGSTSQDEIIRADANRDGVVTDTELTQARFEINQAQERATADQTGQTDAERKEAAIRRYNELNQQQAEAAAQAQQATERDTSGKLVGAAFVIFEAESLPAGTLAADSPTLVTLSMKIKEAIEAQGSEVTVREGRDSTTQQPYSMLAFNYHEGSAEHGKIQETLRDALREGGVQKYFGIEPGEENQRETAPITRTVALNEQPLAIALDAPNPLLESQLRATGATVSNEPVQDRPGLVVVLDTNKGEQLAGVEQTLTRLPAAALVIEGPEATEMRQQLTQNYREAGGVAPALQAEAILPERIQNDVPERLREAGATVAPASAAVYAERPELPENTLTVRYPLDQPEVMGRVSVVLDQVNSRSVQLAADLGQAPDATTGSVVETPLAQQTRQLVAKEQGMEAAGPRELPERQPTEDLKIARPKNEVLEASAPPAAEQPATTVAEPTAVAARPISAEPEPNVIERRIILDISAEKAGMGPLFEAGLAKSGFEVRTAPIQAAGEEKAGLRIEALYRTMDSVAAREKQQAEIEKIAAPGLRAQGIALYEPAGQAQERAEALKPVMPLKGADGKVDGKRMVGAGQMLKAHVTVLEVDGSGVRTGKLWEDLRAQGGKVDDIRKIPAGAEGTKLQFEVAYRPGDDRLPKLSATLEAAARGEGIQVTETDDMRRERLARTALLERKELAKLSPEQQKTYERPPGKEYPASQPDAYERVALTSAALQTQAGVKALREELKATGAIVAVQQLDGRPANSGTLMLSYAAEGPKAGAVNEVVADFAAKGGHVYDLKAGHDRGAELVQTAVEAVARPLSAEQEREQERQGNLAEMRALEVRREALLETQREGLAKSQLAEQYLAPAAAAVVVAVETVEAKAWVGFGPDLRGEDLRQTDATGMDLRGANLAGQDLRSTDLRGSDLREANLTGADLRGVNLTGVRLEDAVMDGAQLEKAFRVVENEGGPRQMEDNLTPAVLTGPEREGAAFAPTVAMNEQRLATPEMVAAGEDNSPAAAPRMAMLQAPQYSGLGLPSEEEMRAQEKLPVAQAAEPAPVLEGAAGPQGQAVTLLAEQPERPGLSLPTQQEMAQMELAFGAPAPVVELPAVAATQESAKGQLTAEAVGLEVPAPVAARNALTPYELLEEAGTAQHVATIHLTQPVGAGPELVDDIQFRLRYVGADFERLPGSTTTADGKTETVAFSVVYAHDDRELPALHKELATIANVPDGADFSVRVADENAAGRAATVEGRMENTPEAAKALAAELHDGDQSTARVLVQRPALEDVWALEDKGATVERLYLPDGPAAMVSYPASEAGVTSAVSLELDRIERDSSLTRPPHNSNDREVSGPLLGEDPAQQERRQDMAKAEGLVLEPQPRYELQEMAERDARAKSYFQEEIARPSDPMSGQLANGEPFTGGLTQVLRLEQPDREALEAGWKAEKTTLILVVQEAPGLRLEDEQPAAWPSKVAEALREAGAETQVKDLGVSADTGLEKHLVAVTFDNNDPALARIQATLNRLADQDGVQVPSTGYWERETILGLNGSRMAEPVVAERERPWLEAVVAIEEPTAQERRELTRAGARVEEARMEGNEKPAILVYYDLDNPATVAKVSPVLDRADNDNRLKGETYEAEQARGGRVEQVQADIRQEKQQSGDVWEQFAQKHPQPAKLENAAAEPAVALSFADRLRAAVQEQVEYVRKGWEYGSPENIAVYQAEQRGIADRKALEQQQITQEKQQAADAAAAPQKEREKEAYERGFKGPEAAPAPAEAGKAVEKAPVAPDAEKTVPVPVTAAEVAAQAALSGGVAAGTNGTNGELASDKVLRERRDDERTVPVVMDGPKESKILETTEQVVKPTTAGAPDQAKAEGEKALTPPPAVETKAVTAAVVTAQETMKPDERQFKHVQELQHGIIGMGDSTKSSAEDRMERVRAALSGAGANVEAVVPPTRENKDATLAYSYDPLDKKLPEINVVLANVNKAQPSMVKEEPHSLHYAGITPNAHDIAKQDWPARAGQFNKAHIVVDDFDQRGQGRAEAVKTAFVQEGAVVGEAKKDGHGHVELDVTYHTHSPNIEKINRTLDQAGNTPGIEVQESSTDRSARYQGANDREQTKGAEKERERGE